MERVVKALNSAQSPVHWATLAGFLAIAVILRLIAFQGYSDSDPRAYSELANDLAQGTLHIPEYGGPPVFPLRLGVYAPTAVLIRVFGLSEPTFVVYPLLVSIFGCLLAYALAQYLGTPIAGLIALGALAVLPLDVSTASVLYPDAIAAFWANVGIALACVALNRLKLWQSALLGVLSGAFVGVSWLCKESVAYLVPFVAILILVIHRHLRLPSRITCLAAIGTGSLAVLLAETAFYGRLTGDPLFHLHATERNYDQCPVWFFNESSPVFGWENGGYAKALVKRLFYHGPIDIVFNWQMSLAPALALLGVAWAVLFRKRSFLVPGVWLVLLLLLFNFMTCSFSSYRPLPTFDRYLWPILLPSLILMGVFLATLLAGECDPVVVRDRRFWAVALILAFCGASSPGVRGWIVHKQNGMERKLATSLRETDIVYTDCRTAANLVFFGTGLLSPSDAATIPYEKADQRTIPKGAYVFVNHEMVDFLQKSYGYEGPEFAAKPPSTWRGGGVTATRICTSSAASE